MAHIPLVRVVKQYLDQHFPVNNDIFTRQTSEIVEEFSPFHVEAFRRLEKLYFNKRVWKYCKRIWRGNLTTNIQRRNDLFRAFRNLVKRKCYNRFPTPRGHGLWVNGTRAQIARMMETNRRLVIGEDSSDSEDEQSSSSGSDSSSSHDSDRPRRVRRRRGRRAARRARVQRARARNNTRRGPTRAARPSRSAPTQNRAEVGIPSAPVQDDTAGARNRGDPSLESRSANHLRHVHSSAAGNNSRPDPRNGGWSARPIGVGKTTTASAVGGNVVQRRVNPAPPERTRRYGRRPGRGKYQQAPTYASWVRRVLARRFDSTTAPLSSTSVQEAPGSGIEVQRVASGILRTVALEDASYVSSSDSRVSDWVQGQYRIVHAGGFPRCALGKHEACAAHGFSSSSVGCSAGLVAAKAYDYENNCGRLADAL